MLLSRNFREELKAKMWGRESVPERLYKVLFDYPAAATTGILVD